MEEGDALMLLATWGGIWGVVSAACTNGGERQK